MINLFSLNWVDYNLVNILKSYTKFYFVLKLMNMKRNNLEMNIVICVGDGVDTHFISVYFFRTTIIFYHSGCIVFLSLKNEQNNAKLLAKA